MHIRTYNWGNIALLLMIPFVLQHTTMSLTASIVFVCLVIYISISNIKGDVIIRRSGRYYIYGDHVWHLDDIPEIRYDEKEGVVIKCKFKDGSIVDYKVSPIGAPKWIMKRFADEWVDIRLGNLKLV